MLLFYGVKWTYEIGGVTPSFTRKKMFEKGTVPTTYFNSSMEFNMS